MKQWNLPSISYIYMAVGGLKKKLNEIETFAVNRTHKGN